MIIGTLNLAVPMPEDVPGIADDGETLAEWLMKKGLTPEHAQVEVEAALPGVSSSSASRSAPGAWATTCSKPRHRPRGAKAGHELQPAQVCWA